MPEGHTIHRLARDHGRWFLDQAVRVESPQGRFAAEASVLSGRRLTAVEAYGKHLLYHWAGLRRVLHIHLGLYGKFRIHVGEPPPPRGAVRMRWTSASRGLDLNGPTACELLNASQRRKLLDRLGPDPLRPDADVEGFIRRVRRSRAAIGSLLLNQSVLAGVGNVYRAEILHMLAIHPEREGRSLSLEQIEGVWRAASRLLRIGVRYNRIITTDPDIVGKPRSRMRRDERLLVYRKTKCGRCGGPVAQWELAARRMYACAACQQ